MDDLAVITALNHRILLEKILLKLKCYPPASINILTSEMINIIVHCITYA